MYNEGFDRLGCIGCPLVKRSFREQEFERWPTYKRAYLRAFDKIAKHRVINGINNGKTAWNTGQEIFDWWMDFKPLPPEIMDGQIEMDEYD